MSHNTTSKVGVQVAPTEPGEVVLRPRNVQFDTSHTPLHWIPNEPVVSHFISAFNLLLPEGERTFVDTFTRALPYVKDDKIREAMIGFMGQEAVHAETHNKVLGDFLETNGINVKPALAQIEYITHMFERTNELRSETLRYRIMVEKLAVIAGIEHFTAVLGDWILNSKLEDFDADPVMLDMYRWHGAEEVEHRSVAYDVARYFQIRRGHLMVTFALTSILPFFALLRYTKFLVRQDPSLPNYGKIGIIRQLNKAIQRGAFLRWRDLARSAVDFMRPDFSPDQVGSTAQAVAYLSTSPAAKAAAAAAH